MAVRKEVRVVEEAEEEMGEVNALKEKMKIED